jgi:hypothetical protein
MVGILNIVVTGVNFAFYRVLGTEVGTLSSNVKIGFVCGRVHETV